MKKGKLISSILILVTGMTVLQAQQLHPEVVIDVNIFSVSDEGKRRSAWYPFKTAYMSFTCRRRT